MNPIVFALRRPISTMMLVLTLMSGGALASYMMRLDIPGPINATKVYAYLDFVGTRVKPMKEYIVGKFDSFFHKHEEEHHEELRKVVVTSPKIMDVTITQPYVCQIRSRSHIDVCALEPGYLQEIAVREGQTVKKGDVMFKILPTLYKAKWDAKEAEATLALREYQNTRGLFDRKPTPVVSQNEVLLFEAKKLRARAEADLAKAEFNFANVKAPFDGIVDRQRQQLGSFIKEGEILTTLSDNGVMWVYFNVPEAQYLAFKAMSEQERQEQKIELKLANQEIFRHPATALTIEGQFNNQTGNIAFRADFDNPDRLLRHGQTGTILIHRPFKNALVIPQRATFELLDKRYVWVVSEDERAHQKLITIKHELDDIFIINSGLDVKDKIVLEGVREVEEGGKVEYEFRKPEEALNNQKFHAE